MNVVLAASEAAPFAKTGGLADVICALIKEFTRAGLNAWVVMPFYRSARTRFDTFDTGLEFTVPMGDEVLKGGVRTYGDSAIFVECDELFDRRELYGTPEGDYKDNARRFIFLSRAVLEALKMLDLKPDVLHVNDWQTALVPLYLKTLYGKDDFFKDTATMMTIHNLGYQGLFEPEQVVPQIGLGWGIFTPEGIEFYGKVNLLKAGLISADALTTVSESYASEIQGRKYGFGLDGVLKRKSRALKGILNGVDYEEWDPRTDTVIPAQYSPADMAGKIKCKARLMRRFSFGDPTKPVAGFVGRLSLQKGLDIFVEALEEMVSNGLYIVMLGRGDVALHERLKKLQKNYKKNFALVIKYNDALARLIYSGSDLFLMPSRYEPCGLGQLIAQRYGSVPVARRTGGIRDTVRDYDPMNGEGTGFLFTDYSADALAGAVKRALDVYSDTAAWESLRRNAMGADFSWAVSARKYMDLYAAIAKKRP